MKLNIAQKKAIHLIHGPCLVLAGAGSGKTSVIINKIIQLINIYQYDPAKIITITFTNKAADEIRWRLLHVLSNDIIKKLSIFTFHAFGLKIIRKEIKILGFSSSSSSSLTLLNNYEQLRVLKDLASIDLNNNINLLKVLLNQIKEWKNLLLSPKSVHLHIKKILNEKFFYLYNKYTNFLTSHNLLDFDDLIFIPTLLLKIIYWLERVGKKKIQYLLVDEYQDTNHSQYELIKVLSGNDPNFTLVGDDDQSIYSWRGARPKNFYLLKDDFPKLNVVKMEQNYRSSGCILKAANQLISNNSNIFNKKIIFYFSVWQKIHIFVTLNEIHEAKVIIDHIKIHKNLYKKKFKDYVILYRNNYQAKIFEFELIYRNIPYYIHEGNSFFDNSEIKDLLAYLRLIVNPYDDLAFLRIINVPRRKIGSVTLIKLKTLAKKFKISLFHACIDERIMCFFKKNTILILHNFITWIKKIMLLVPRKSKKILDLVIKKIDYIGWLNIKIKDSMLLMKTIKNIKIFSKWLNNILNKKNTEKPIMLGDGLLHLITDQNFHQNIKKKHLNKTFDKLRLMTLHASKGLEFLVVYIVGLEEGTLPHQKSILNNNVSEERRLMYVGITRARQQLFLSFCKKKKKFGIKENLQPSRFLLELPRSSVVWFNK
nr:UvrD-helicase domain-containing protein [Buchnera aphidicola]